MLEQPRAFNAVVERWLRERRLAREALLPVAGSGP
jgi:hypothetical protein